MIESMNNGHALWVRWRRWLTICGLVVLSMGGGIGGWYMWSHFTVRITPQGEVAVSRRQAVDERQPTVATVQAYQVAPERPRYLTIDKIGVAARVLPVERDNAGRIAAPKGIWDVGWYTASSLPGQPGVTFIDGHITGPSQPAVFRDLDTLAPGDELSIEQGNGTRLTYRVRSMTQRPYESIDMSALLQTTPDGRPTLALMTCAGNFDKATYHYDQRIVVIATLV